MAQKRQQEDGKYRTSEDGIAEDKRRKLRSFRSVVMEVLKMQSLQDSLEPLIRRVVKEEVEAALKKYLTHMKRNYDKDVHPSELRNLQLKFVNNLSLPVFTGSRIEGEDSCNLKVALVDAFTEQIISSGPMSLAKVEIVVLEGDFDGDEGNNWTLEEFKTNIVREREGKKPLLTGDTFVNLQEGVGLVGEISFTDNSSWTRSRKFRLGARVVDNSDETRVREAKTESFIVRDHRVYKKHYPPSLFDEVWRLEKIGKDGAFHKRLSRENIHTVKDFLTLLVLDSPRLRNILGTGMSAKMWEVTVEHARTCMLDKKLYIYPPSGSQQKSGVVFNVVGQVMGAYIEGHFVSINEISDTEKAGLFRAEAQNLVITAFKHWDQVEAFDDDTILTVGSSQISNIQYPSSSPKTESSNGSKSLTSQKIGKFGFAQPTASSPDIISSIYSIGGMSSLDDLTMHGIDSVDLRYDQHLNLPVEVNNSLICDTESMMTQALCGDEHLQFFNTECPLQLQESQADLQSVVSNFLQSRSVDKAQRRWSKVYSVLKWFSIRKIVTLRRNLLENAEIPVMACRI
ncbi:Calmodulin binding protein, central domain [Dillenia turbinata]|uniref:Calmodulin binding protein, central domain n=1 Tax=Dillenia turbinata TaxID=194707 RepID=A0AAN8YZD5_9MAGN